MSRRITAGNDAPFRWAVTLQGKPFDLTGKDVKVYVINSRGEIPVAQLTIEGHEVSGVFEGRYQTRLGEHSLVLHVNEGRPEMKTAAVANVFELVQWSADAGGSDEGDVIVAPVLIESELSIGMGGGSSYDDTEVKNELARLEREKADKSELTELSAEVGKKQDTLVSGTNIKTINGQSIVGSGNIEIQGGGGSGDDTMTKILAGQSNFIVFEDVDGNMNVVNESLRKYKMANFGSRVKRIITCGLYDATGTESASMFGGDVYQQNPCSNLESIDCIISFPSTCTSARRTFADVHKISSIDLSLFDTSNCTDFAMMFNSTESLEYLDLTRMNTGNGTSFESMFKRCFAKRIDMPLDGLDLRKATKLTGMFSEGAAGDECPHNRSIGLLNVTGNNAIAEDAASPSYSTNMFGSYLYTSRNKITHLDGLRGLCVSLYLGWCKLLDNESVYNVINEASGGTEDAHIVITLATNQYDYAVNNAEIMAMCRDKFIDIANG